MPLHVGSLAQLVEQGTFNPKVVGSTPTRPTTFFLAIIPTVTAVPAATHPFRATYMLAADLMKDLLPAYFIG